MHTAIQSATVTIIAVVLFTGVVLGQQAPVPRRSSRPQTEYEWISNPPSPDVFNEALLVILGASADEGVFAEIKERFDPKEKNWFTTVALPGALPSQCRIRQLVEQFPGTDPKNHSVLLLPLFSKPYMEYRCKIPIPPVHLQQAYEAGARVLQDAEFGWYTMPEYEILNVDERTHGRHHQVSVRAPGGLPGEQGPFEVTTPTHMTVAYDEPADSKSESFLYLIVVPPVTRVQLPQFGDHFIPVPDPRIHLLDVLTRRSSPFQMTQDFA